MLAMLKRGKRRVTGLVRGGNNKQQHYCLLLHTDLTTETWKRVKV